MKVTIKERLVLPNVFPQHSDIITLWLCKEIGAKVQLTPEERERVRLRVENERLVWDGEASIDVDFTRPEMKLVADALVTMNTEKKLTVDHLELYEKFVGKVPATEGK